MFQSPFLFRLFYYENIPIYFNLFFPKSQTGFTEVEKKRRFSFVLYLCRTVVETVLCKYFYI
jgi:hypothetical protein